MRLQKRLASAGLGSRREIETWIKAGRIKVNGVIAQLGVQVKPDDHIQIDGKKVQLPTSQITKLLLYHKPEGEICSHSDEKDRPTVYDNLPPIKHSKWISIGRLDLNTSGLLLLTNDGELANELMHPKNQVEREYLVRVLGEFTKEKQQQLLSGVKLEDGMATCKSIQAEGGGGANRWFRVVITEGRNREVRRIFEAVDCKVSRLKRIRFGQWHLPRDLAPGKYTIEHL